MNYEERGSEIEIDDIEICTDTDDVDKVEIYMLDAEGNRIEGGTFDKQDFMLAILTFYHLNY